MSTHFYRVGFNYELVYNTKPLFAIHGLTLENIQ